MEVEYVSTSLAGRWGESRQRKRKTDTELRQATTFRDSFHDLHIKEHKEKNLNNIYSRYRSNQENCHMLLPYGLNNPHLRAAHVEDVREEEEEENPDSRFTTTSGLLFRNEPSSKTIHLSRTYDRMKTSVYAPVAKGRSGRKLDIGVSTSGLLGEKLNLEESPSTNSVVQRAWLPRPDPALMYRISHPHNPAETRISAPASTASINGNDDNNGLNRIGRGNPVAEGWVHQRRSLLNPGPLAKGTRMFLDDPPNGNQRSYDE